MGLKGGETQGHWAGIKGRKGRMLAPARAKKAWAVVHVLRHLALTFSSNPRLLSIADEDVESVDEEDDAATSDEAATPQTGSRQRPTAGASGAMAAAGDVWLGVESARNNCHLASAAVLRFYPALSQLRQCHTPGHTCLNILFLTILSLLSSVAGQLGTVGRQLGTILSSIVQQLRNIKKQFGYPAKLTRVYELVFGKVVRPAAEAAGQSAT